MDEKPDSIDKYRKWLKEKQDTEIGEKQKNHYNSVVNRVKQDFENSDFWKEILGNLNQYDQEYQLLTGFPLFDPKSSPLLVFKPFDSFFEKTFRKNILENQNWPSEPQDGWILPKNWFIRINDMVRTLLVVKYFDGVKFVTEKLTSVCKKYDIDVDISFEAREGGYYAAHLNVRRLFEVPRITFDTEKIHISVEIQITTQLQEVLRKLLHTYYERKRMMAIKPIEKWQWDYRSEEFCTSYLGHILHYVEGMIVDIREKQKKGYV